VAAHEVGLAHGDARIKVRSTVWPVVWTVLTLGVYGAYWWYQVNRELRDVGRVYQRPELGDSPGTSLLAMVPGFLVIVPPFVSLYNGCKRVQAAQELAGIPERDRLNGWIALVLVFVGVFFLFIPFVISFIQSELNKVWRTPGITEDPNVGLEHLVAAPPPPPPAGAEAHKDPAPQATAAPPTLKTPPPVPSQAPPAPAVAAEADPQLDRLERLAALRDSGGITPEEYEAQKTKILSEL
jgi:hypothetical protein